MSFRMCPMVKLAPQTNYYQGKIIDKKGSNQFGQGSPPNLDNAQKRGFFLRGLPLGGGLTVAIHRNVVHS